MRDLNCNPSRGASLVPIQMLPTAIWAQQNFYKVVGTFTAPEPQNSNNGSAAIWVGIDGITCTNAILRTGVNVNVTNGQASYTAWYQWFPNPWVQYTTLPINPGDILTAGVYSPSSQSATTWIENVTTNITVTQQLSSSFPLCFQDAEWIVEDYKVNGTLVPFGGFGNVTFTNAFANATGGYVFSPSGAAILNIRQNNTNLTSTSIGDNNVTVKYV